MSQQLNSYRQMDTLGKSQIDLILQVYDGAIAAFQSARQNYEDKDFNAGYEQIERAKRFLTHLYTTLDFEQGGEVADNLGQLYAFVLNQANVVQATKDMDKIDDNVNILRNLRSGWSDLKTQVGTQAKAQAPQQPEQPAASDQPAARLQINTSA